MFSDGRVQLNLNGVDPNCILQTSVFPISSKTEEGRAGATRTELDALSAVVVVDDAYSHFWCAGWGIPISISVRGRCPN